MIPKIKILLLLGVIPAILSAMISQAHAQVAAGPPEINPIIVLSAALAFGMAAIAAGIGLAYGVTAVMAAMAENPKVRSSAFIFLGMIESIVIYGIVMLFVILAAGRG